MTHITPKDHAKSGFGVEFEWDIPLLTGYKYIFANNIAKRPSLHTKRGIVLGNIDDLFRQLDPELIIVFGWFLYGYHQIINYANSHKIPLFVRGDSNLVMCRSSLKEIARGIFLRHLFNKFSGFLSVGTQNSLLYENYGVDRSKIFLAPHSIDTDHFNNEFLTYKKTTKNEKITIGFAGKFTDKKRPYNLLKAVNLSRNKNKIKIILIGAGPLSKKLKRMSAKLDLDVDFRGFLNQTQIVRKGYFDLDCLVVPSSNYETWGLVVNEVMTGGIPVIVSDMVGCGIDLIEEGKTGFSFDHTRIEDFTKKIDRFIQMKEEGFPFEYHVKEKINNFSLIKTINGFLSAIGSQCHHNSKK